MNQIIFRDLLHMSYKNAWDYQEELFASIVKRKTENRELPENSRQPTTSYLLFCEHPHVYTLGKSGLLEHLLLDNNELKNKQIEFFKINRGGDITYHGPGQVVGYPIIDLDNFFTDIGKYLRLLEETIILTLADYGITGGRIKGLTGVWLDWEDERKARKICAMGVKCSRWVTMHGWAFNVNTDLSYFNHIVPCGITDKTVTSMEKELGRKTDLEEVKHKLKHHFASLFNAQLLNS